MIGYGGATTNAASVAQLAKVGWGMMIAPQNPKRAATRYAVDNGAFYCWTKKKPWNEEKFLKMLDRVETFERRPDFGCCPDKVAEGMTSLEFSMAWIDKLPRAYPWYLAVQNGMTVEAVREVLPKYAGIFVGGTADWKMQTLATWTRLAREEGKIIHVGRVNTPPRTFVAAKVCKVDSIDGTNWNRLWDYFKPEQAANCNQKALDLWGLH
jgi:hypothetical protein